MRRHIFCRFVVCFVFASLCAFTFFAPPIVTAHAFAITSAFVLVAGTILASLGVTFATNTELQKGAATFYNSLATGAANVKTFIDEQVKKVTAGTAAVMTIPTACFIQAKQAVATTFPKTGTVVEDTSGAGSLFWSSYVGKTINSIAGGSGVHLPCSLVLNKLPAYSPNVGKPIYNNFSPVINSNLLNDGHVKFVSNEVTRLIGPSGKTYDYTTFLCSTPDGLILELAQNGSYVGGKTILFSGTFKQISDFAFETNGSDVSFWSVVEYYDEFEVLQVTRNYFTIFSSSETSPIGVIDNRMCTFAGVVDGRTGVVALPQVGYAPDQTLVGQDVWNGALDDVIAKNPSFSGVDVSIPAAEADLINAKWDKVVTAQMDLIKALTDRIAALENTGGATKPDTSVDIGNVGATTVTNVTGQLASAGTMLDNFQGDFTVAVGGLDPNIQIPNSFSSSVLWVNAQFAKCFGQLSDFKFIILYPMFIGFAMLMIGRGGQSALSTTIRKRNVEAKAFHSKPTHVKGGEK